MIRAPRGQLRRKTFGCALLLLLSCARPASPPRAPLEEVPIRTPEEKARDADALARGVGGVPPLNPNAPLPYVPPLMTSTGRGGHGRRR